MPRLGNLDFDYQILEAIKDGRFVVFAGAGVSMGPPSNLDSFWTLAEKIAGEPPKEPLDRFLGQLHHKGVKVHERALQLLSPAGSAPTDLHRDLIRLFGAADRIRLVTTNFDLHFETAAKDAFGVEPTIYRGPAVPLGYNFQGIVHVHGALPHASSIVLTDADFGKAYLTDGWARRFLMEVFRTYTVLFVGYSHDDVVMNYLARALPPGGSAGRFALTDTDGNWSLLGIRPIRFTKGPGSDAFRELYEGVSKLAERGGRDTLVWQARMLELVGRAPSVDPELVDEILQALRDLPTCRFFANVARHADWPQWLNARKLIDALFQPGDLDEKQRVLAAWLAEHYAHEHPGQCVDLIATNGLRLNPILWWAIGSEIGASTSKTIDAATLRQWVSLLLATAPEQGDRHVFMTLAKRCDALGLHDCALALFLHLCRHKFELKKGLAWRDEGEVEPPVRYLPKCSIPIDHWTLNTIYERRIKPRLAQLAQPLLGGMIHRFSRMHAERSTWSGRGADAFSIGRSAIEPHEQDRYTETVDVLIDAARDALEWLAANQPAQLDAWVEQLVSSGQPLLRRLAVHAIAMSPNAGADERIAWMLKRIGVDARAEHHEIHHLVALNYATANEQTRRSLINAIAAVEFDDVEGQTGEVRALRFQFDWLSWLLTADPDDALAQAVLAPIRERFPRWEVPEHLDLTHWTGAVGWVEERSPWSTGQLLAQPPRDQLNALLEFRGDFFNGPSREGLLSAVRDAAKHTLAWGFDLATELQARDLWSSDLWSAVLRGFQDADLDEAVWERLLVLVANASLHAEHAREITDLLLRLVKDGGKPFAAELLPLANPVADVLWDAIAPGDEGVFDENWLTLAINRPAGVLAEYWLAALSVALQGKEGADWAMPAYFRERFTAILRDATLKGANARSVLASQTAYFFRLDEAWTNEHLLPLFQDADERKFAQAWHGFLAWGRLYPKLVQAMLPAFVAAIARVGDLPGQRPRLVEFYTAVCAFHVDDPMQQLLPVLFIHATPEDRNTFAAQIGYFLRQLDPEATMRLWDTWLSRYWHARLEGLLAPLEPSEAGQMVDWLPHLGAQFPAAVSLATQMPPVPADHSHAVYELRESALVAQFPRDTARLLIYLANGLPAYQGGYIADVARRLGELPADLRRDLDEALARAGVAQ